MKGLRRMKAIFVLAVSTISMMAAATIVAAQDKTVLPPPPLPVDPTPLVKLITDQERAMLADARKPKKMVEVYLDIADAHLDDSLRGSESRARARSPSAS